jgi:hypothetical protein
MQALFVHGMGRTPLSGFRLLRRLRKLGVETVTFFYSVTFQNYSSIENRLRQKVIEMAGRGDYVMVGHSLGGVLIRSVLGSLPAGTRLPKRVFLMGSPVRPSRIAKYLQRNWLFRLATGDCGQLLGSDDRMQEIAPCSVPTTSFVGTSGLHGRISPFGDEVNDGIVSASEISAPWITEQLEVPVVHSWMPSSKHVSELIVERISQEAQTLSQPTK